MPGHLSKHFLVVLSAYAPVGQFRTQEKVELSANHPKGQVETQRLLVKSAKAVRS